MECSFGITGQGYCLIASDSNAARSIVKMKGDEDKMKVLSEHLVMAYSGESGECGGVGAAAAGRQDEGWAAQRQGAPGKAAPAQHTEASVAPQGSRCTAD